MIQLHNWIEAMSPAIKNFLDVVALTASAIVYLTTVVVSLLPGLTALASLVWIVLRIYWGYKEHQTYEHNKDK